MAQARENDYPRWATDGGASVVEPNEGRKDTGFEADDEADEAEFNWLHRTTYRNIRFLDEDHAGREIRGTTSWMTSGFGFVAGTGLVGPCGAGVISRAGARLELDADFLTATAQDEHTFTASRDTYVFVDDERLFTFVAVANGAGAPATPAGTTRYQIVITDASDITDVTDSVLRGPIMAPIEGIRVSPQLIIGLNGGVPALLFDVGTAGAGAVLGRVQDAAPNPIANTYYSRAWQRASSRIEEILDGAASIHAVGNTATNLAAKQWSFAALHYSNNTEEPVGLVRAAIDNVDNVVQVGGGASHLNAATRVQLYAAANRTTTTGTLLLELQGATSLIYMPGGLAQLGNGSSTTPVFTFNRVASGEGGIEHSEAGSRRWLGPYTASGVNDDLLFWRFSGGSDQGVSLRLRSSDGAVIAETVGGLWVSNQHSLTTRGLLINTNIGAEGGSVYDSELFELRTKIVETNTNGNEDLNILSSSQLPSDGVFWIEFRILGVDDTDPTRNYARRQVFIYLRDGAAGVSFDRSLEDTGAVGGSAGWDGGPATAGISVSSGNIILRVTSNNTTRRNWIVLLTWGRMRAFNNP